MFWFQRLSLGLLLLVELVAAHEGKFGQKDRNKDLKAPSGSEVRRAELRGVCAMLTVFWVVGGRRWGRVVGGG